MKLTENKGGAFVFRGDKKHWLQDRDSFGYPKDLLDNIMDLREKKRVKKIMQKLHIPYNRSLARLIRLAETKQHLFVILQEVFEKWENEAAEHIAENEYKDPVYYTKDAVLAGDLREALLLIQDGYYDTVEVQKRRRKQETSALAEFKTKMSEMMQEKIRLARREFKVRVAIARALGLDANYLYDPINELVLLNNFDESEDVHDENDARMLENKIKGITVKIINHED